MSRLQFISRAKHLGFSLKEINELLALKIDPTTTCKDVRVRAETKISEIEDKVRELARIKQALTRLVASCSQPGVASDCAILDALDTEPLL